MESFSRLGLADPLAEALASFGFANPTAVQAEAIPLILSRRDAIIESETGTGKTFAYLAPAFQLVSTLERKDSGEPGAIIAAPTQELAVQIGREAERLAKAASLPFKTVVLLGGTPLEKQAAKLKMKPEIVVGTLGRLADLVALGKLRTSALKLLVLDEADRLFARETEELAIKLLKSAPSSAVRVLVSATIPERSRREMRPLLRDAVEICPQSESVLSGSIEHWCFYCDGRKRLDFARRFDAAIHPTRCLLFLTMATRVEKAAAALEHLGLSIEAIHSGLDKESRHVALERFSSGEVRYLLTSDLGARGLDIAGISHVISLDLPEEATIYTHRAGRTGRAGAKGISIVLADGVELARASKIATKGGFVFRCKVLEEGKVVEPTSEEFFARASGAEEQRMAAKAANVGSGERKTGARRRSDESGRASGRSGERSPRRTPEHSPGRAPERALEERGAPRRRERAQPIDDTPEAPRTARKPASAPWRPAEESGAKSESHKLLHKKDDLAKESREAAPRPRPAAPEDGASRRPPRFDSRSRDERPSPSRREAPRSSPRSAPDREGAPRRTAASGARPTGGSSRGSAPHSATSRGPASRGGPAPRSGVAPRSGAARRLGSAGGAPRDDAKRRDRKPRP
jgi:ATP-dependent RNA helicase DeaD